jgi:hypothetical protein
MKSIAGFILSAVAAVLYVIILFILVHGGFNLTTGTNSLLGALAGALVLLVILLPLLIILVIVSLAGIVLVVIGTILTGAGKTRAGGIITIVGSAIGFLLSFMFYFVPLGLGIAGGIVAIVQGRNRA